MRTVTYVLHFGTQGKTRKIEGNIQLVALAIFKDLVINTRRGTDAYIVNEKSSRKEVVRVYSRVFSNLPADAIKQKLKQFFELSNLWNDKCEEFVTINNIKNDLFESTHTKNKELKQLEERFNILEDEVAKLRTLYENLARDLGV